MSQINPQRDRTIGEMNDKEIGYIDSHSIGRDFENNEIQQAIYFLFHRDPFSINKSYDTNEDNEFYSIKLQCTIENNTKLFKVLGNPKISRKDYSVCKNKVIILKVGEENINDYDATMLNEFENDELHDEVYDFIEMILEQDENDEESDNLYFSAWQNSTLLILEFLNIYDWIQIEYCLKRLYQESNDDSNNTTLLYTLSNYETCKKYINTILSEEIEELYVDSEIHNSIDSIAGLYQEKIVKSGEDSPLEEIIDKIPAKKTMKELLNELKKAEKEEDFDKALELNEEIRKQKTLEEEGKKEDIKDNKNKD